MSSRDTSPKKKSRHKVALEPISMDEILAGAGMSGFVSILDPPEEVPHLQALVDDIREKRAAPRLPPEISTSTPVLEKVPAVEWDTHPLTLAPPEMHDP